ncbi:MAG: hypothetical protein P9M14_17375 [Candidatus Alcyoniella australis]|nr:hypothetical protein [Candidatus Alcyoniella australis]
MARRALSIAIALVLFLAAGATAQFAKPQIMDRESGFSRIMWLEDDATLYNMRWTVKRFERDGRKFYLYDGQGDNGKSGAERIDWTEESSVEICDSGMLRTQYWKKVSSGAEQMTWDLRYDWTAHKLSYRFEDRVAGKVEEQQIAIADDAWPGDALNFLLRGFPFERGAGYKVTGNLLMTDGSVLGGHIIHHGEERIKTVFGEIDCYKLELKPTGALGWVAPDMFMWFTKAAPHCWVRYDGRDEGFIKPRTKNVLLQFEPAEAIK